MAQNDFLECIPWDGTEADLPVGEITTIPDFRAVNLVRRWEVLDVEEDAGFREVRLSEIRPGDTIIGCQINEKSFDKVVSTHGKRFFVAKRAAGGAMLDRWEWKAAYGSDVLELEALKQIRQNQGTFKIGGK